VSCHQTGSTNITDNGLFGQSNVGHAVRDPALAANGIVRHGIRSAR
jgi:hypothetical protein